MLTNEDLLSIKLLVKEVVSQEIVIALKPLEKRIRKLEGRIRKMEKDLKTVIIFFDSEIMDARRKIDRLETFVGLPHELP